MTDAEFPPRTWDRGMWRWYHRQSRICARESAKVLADAVIYGAGFTKISADGVQHIPYRQAMNELMDNAVFAHCL